MPALRNKVAIVTGAGGSIGRAAAIRFAAEGARVLVADIRSDAAGETVERIVTSGGEAIPFVADVSKANEVEAMVDATVRTFGGLDLAFNNAGMTDPEDSIWDEGVFRRLLEVNLVSQMLCMKYELPQMVARGQGAIVNMSSIMGVITQREPVLIGYTASKHGVIGLTKAAALQYADRQVRINALCPGVTRSPMVDAAMASSEAARKHLEHYAPLRGMAEPEEIAAAALWLCSDDSSFVTGHALIVDGGYTIQ